MTNRALPLLLLTLFATATSGRAADAQVSVVGNSVQEHQALPGSEYEGSIVLRNDGAQAQQVNVYLTDYRFSANGASDFAEAGTLQRSNARWITFGSQNVVVLPHQSATVTYRIKVPRPQTDSISGSYWSIAMVEGQPIAASATKPGVQIRTVIRQAIQLVTHVGSTGSASVSFANVKVVPDSIGMALSFDTQNDGVRARRLSLSVDLYGENGVLVGRYTRARGLVYPGCSIRQSFGIGTLKKGKYVAFLVADAGDDDLFAGTFKLTI
jgi:hypothetical protein